MRYFLLGYSYATHLVVWRRTVAGPETAGAVMYDRYLDSFGAWSAVDEGWLTRSVEGMTELEIDKTAATAILAIYGIGAPTWW